MTSQRPSRPPRRKARPIKILPRRRPPRRPLLRVRRRLPRTRHRPLPINLRPPRANPHRTQGTPPRRRNRTRSSRPTAQRQLLPTTRGRLLRRLNLPSSRYNFFVVRDKTVMVEPSTYKIVDVLPRTGRSTAAAPGSAPSSHNKATFSDKDRETIRKHARSSRTEQRTTGSSTTSTRVRIGALAGVRGDPILPRDGLSRITGAA